MAKNDYQEAAMNYADDYLERMLKIERIAGKYMDKSVDRIVEQKFRQFIDEQKAELGRNPGKQEMNQ